MTDPVPTLKNFLRQPALARGPKRLVVACSGGADSVALLVAAAQAGPALGWDVAALHCQHGLRGAAAKADAALVEGLCGGQGLRLLRFDAKLAPGPGTEARARAWRRRCYAQAAEGSGARLVLLAHHARDQAETLLLNLARGAGSKGAAAMLALAPLEGCVGVRLGRPFLGLLPQDLRRWLKGKRVAWREDASNLDQRLARNRVRHAVLPQLEAINPRAVAHLAAFSADLACRKAAPGLEAALGLDRAARARVLALLKRGHGSTDLGGGRQLLVSAGSLHLKGGVFGGRDASGPAWAFSPGSRAAEDASVEAPLAAEAPQCAAEAVELGLGPTEWGAWSFQLKPGRAEARKLGQASAYWFSPALLGAGARLRAALPGERLRPFGFNGSRLIRDILADAGVPAWQRPLWPLLEARGKPLALPGIRRGQGLEAEPGQAALTLTWQAPAGALLDQAEG
jgi:tRNA(Ile)-lysidine synthase